MYIAVCDDQIDELNIVTDILSGWQAGHPGVMRFKTYRSGVELMAEAKNEQFGIYLLDVMMPGFTGMEAAKEIRSFDENAVIVFLTSSPGFAYESYSVKALDYLLKPVSEEKLTAILDRLYRDSHKPESSVTLKSGGKIIRLPLDRTSHVEVMGKHLYFHRTDGETIEIVAALKEYEDLLLSHKEFFQVHRSYIVNLNHISELSTTEIKMNTGKTVPVSRHRSQDLQQAYMKLLFE